MELPCGSREHCPEAGRGWSLCVPWWCSALITVRITQDLETSPCAAPPHPCFKASRWFEHATRCLTLYKYESPGPYFTRVYSVWIWGFSGGLVDGILGFHCRGLGSVPGRGTDIPQAVRCDQRNNNKKSNNKFPGSDLAGLEWD